MRSWRFTCQFVFYLRKFINNGFPNPRLLNPIYIFSAPDYFFLKCNRLGELESLPSFLISGCLLGLLSDFTFLRILTGSDAFSNVLGTRLWSPPLGQKSLEVLSQERPVTLWATEDDGTRARSQSCSPSSSFSNVTWASSPSIGIPFTNTTVLATFSYLCIDGSMYLGFPAGPHSAVGLMSNLIFYGIVFF